MYAMTGLGRRCAPADTDGEDSPAADEGARAAEPARLIWNRRIDPGQVFDLELPLDQAAAGYEAMDQRDAIKVLLRP